ncbi:MAG: hypothetical protein ACI90U_002682 [Pseudomonadales bacterium]|jgi:hypothetical protein
MSITIYSSKSITLIAYPIIALIAIVLAVVLHTGSVAMFSNIDIQRIYSDMSNRSEKNDLKDLVPAHFIQAGKGDGGVLSLAYLLARLGDTQAALELRNRYSRSNGIIEQERLIRLAAKFAYDFSKTEIGYDDLPKAGEMSVIVKANNQFYVVVHNAGDETVTVFDPRVGAVVGLPKEVFIKAWNGLVIVLKIK